VAINDGWEGAKSMRYKKRRVMASLLLLVSITLATPVSIAAPRTVDAESSPAAFSLGGQTMIPVLGREREEVIERMSLNKDVQLLESALLVGKDDRALWEETEVFRLTAVNQTRSRVVAVLPFQGDADFAGITYILMNKDEEHALGWTVNTIGREQKALSAYYVEGERVVVQQADCFDCTWDCVECWGISPFAAFGCIVACVTCFTIPNPASCALCGGCSGIIGSCAINCCIMGLPPQCP
jgi:hypothetical protein